MHPSLNFLDLLPSLLEPYTRITANMSTQASSPAVKAEAQPLSSVQEQQAILQRAEDLQNRVANILLTTVEDAAERITTTLRQASAKVELGMTIASQRFVDNALNAILEDIEAQRVEIQGKLAAKKLSGSQKLLLETRLSLLDRQEQTAMSQMAGINLLDHKTST